MDWAAQSLYNATNKRINTMKYFFCGLIIIPSLFYGASAQKTLHPNFYSDVHKFQAWFPKEPKREEVVIETRYGEPKGERWTTELPDMTFSISVVRYPEPPVKIEAKQLNIFYRNVCTELIGTTRVGISGYDMFGELGLSCGGRVSKRETTSLQVFLVREIMYVASVTMLDSARNDPDKNQQINDFLDTFLFCYVDSKQQKLVWGLPPELSQTSVTSTKKELKVLNN